MNRKGKSPRVSLKQKYTLLDFAVETQEKQYTCGQLLKSIEMVLYIVAVHNIDKH